MRRLTWVDQLERYWQESVAVVRDEWQAAGQALTVDQAELELLAMGGPTVNPTWAAHQLVLEAR